MCGAAWDLHVCWEGGECGWFWGSCKRSEVVWGTKPVDGPGLFMKERKEGCSNMKTSRDHKVPGGVRFSGDAWEWAKRASHGVCICGVNQAVLVWVIDCMKTVVPIGELRGAGHENPGGWKRLASLNDEPPGFARKTGPCLEEKSSLGPARMPWNHHELRDGLKSCSQRGGGPKLLRRSTGQVLSLYLMRYSDVPVMNGHEAAQKHPSAFKRTCHLTFIW